MKHLLFIITAWLCTDRLAAQHPPPKRLPPEVGVVLDEFIAQLYRDVMQDDMGSISAAVFIGNKIVWAKAYGWANKERHIAADTNTIYRTGSITKTFTAYLMMVLAAEGTISLDEPVAKYLPEIKQLKYPAGSTPVTFRHLASHTAGLSREPALDNAATGSYDGWEQKVLASIPTITVLSKPGIAYQYSNIGYGILGLALSRAAHQPYDQLVQEKILQRAGMYNSFFRIPEGKQGQVATGYSIDAFTGVTDTLQPYMEHAGRGYKVPNGGMYATANDLARFLIMQCNPGASLIDSASVALMTSIQTPESSEYGYGLGYTIRNNDHGIKIVEHDGGVAGYNAFMAYSPKYKTGIVLLRNYDFGLTDILQRPRVTLYELCEAWKELSVK